MTASSDRPKIINFYTSPIGKKIVTGFTGLGLTLFVLFHMTGNLVLLSDSQAYNRLAHFLNSWGIFLYAIEFVLLGLAIFHIASAITVKLNSYQARDTRYSQFKSTGTPSKQSLSSRSMVITGLVLLAFLIFHLQTFKFGTYYSTSIDGVEMRDLAKLVIEKFQHPAYAFGYAGVMIFLGFHLRHGVWSGFQSLGLLNSRLSPSIYTIALILAVLITIGFIVLPLAIYFGYL
ncbi:succinate dehydrogenase cytochrome b subunit [Myxosarcina sp. GI1(2024)]